MISPRRRSTVSLIRLTPPFLFVVGLLIASATAADWHHPLALPGDGYWQARVPITVQNGSDRVLEGTAEEVDVPLTGVRAESVRVCNADGVEMLFALTDPLGHLLTTGEIPAGTKLTIPVECEAGKSARYFVYFGNDGAALLPDFLKPTRSLINGDVEQGVGDTPAGWSHDQADDEHRCLWSKESPQSGRRCLKTVVAPKAEHSWIASRQSGIRIVAGARYRLRAYVKAENVVGAAGWFIHVGNQEDSMLMGPVIRAGDGTFDWKPIETEFTAPINADRATIGTVLRGTGTAWFDNLTLEQLSPGLVQSTVGSIERMPLRESPKVIPQEWPVSLLRKGYARRAVVRAFHFESTPGGERLAAVDLKPILARARGRLDRDSIVVMAGQQRVTHGLLGDTLVLDADALPRSASTWHVYFRDDQPPETDSTTGREPKTAGLVASTRNLVKNPSFEQGQSLPDGWTPSQDSTKGITFGFGQPGAPGLGPQAAKLSVSHDTPKNWRGWRQTVNVEPGCDYLVAGWLKTEDVSDEVRIHAHVQQADGKLCLENGYRSVGSSITGTADWTLLSDILRMSPDAAKLQLHLTMDATGTLWHDGLVVAKVWPAHLVGFEARPLASNDGMALWQVPSVVKVFPDDPAPEQTSASANAIALARNERETLQLAVRSGKAVPGVKVEVESPRGPDGTVLDVEVGVVGIVPIDHPTSYYRSETPVWHRKLPPAHRAGCDGWAGMWPDPLLPTDTFDLGVNETRAIWITAAATQKTPAGNYVGRVKLTAGGRLIRQRDFIVKVWDYTLPERGRFGAIYDVRFGRNPEWWGGPFNEKYPELLKFLADRRLSGDRIFPDPKIDYVDGKVVADFTEFDRVAEWYFDELKLPFSYTPRAFYLFGWAHPPAKKFGEEPYAGERPWEGMDRSQLRPEYKRAYQACLKAFWDHVTEKGWADRFVLYISDEPHYRHEHIVQQMIALCKMIHEVDRKIPIYSSTWGHVPEWDDSLDIWGIAHYGRVPVEQMEKLKREGRRVWFTTDGQMCLDTPYCAVERLLPYYCFKYGVEAYEFWGVAWTTYNPHRFGWHSYINQADMPGHNYWIRYPNGDGFLIYPGAPIDHNGPVSSIRLEQAREGVEDYEALCLLRSRIQSAEAAGRDVTKAKAVLAQAEALVTIPNAGGRYSTKFLPEPAVVNDIRQQVSAAIVAIGQ